MKTAARLRFAWAAIKKVILLSGSTIVLGAFLNSASDGRQASAEGKQKGYRAGMITAIIASPLNTSGKFDARKYKGKNLVLFLYSLDAARVEEATALMTELSSLRREYNFEVVGVSLDADKPREVAQFNSVQGIRFPVHLDHGQELETRLKLRGGLGCFILSKSSRLITYTWGLHVPPGRELQSVWRTKVFKALRINISVPDEPILGIKPEAPKFAGQTLDGRQIKLPDLHRGKPLVLVIFSPGCLHCGHELDFLKEIYEAGELAGRFEVLAVSTQNRARTAKLWRDKQYPFPAVGDPRHEIIGLYRSYIGSVPLSYVIDREGRINAIHRGHSSKMDRLYMMELKKLAELENPPLLEKGGYSGQSSCRICHERQYIQWSLTRHSDAFLSLIRKGEERNEECVSCHVTGYNKPGGYSRDYPVQYLENVQCESCHGPGHEACSGIETVRNRKRSFSEWEKLCLECHTKKESLNFVFATRFPKVLHLDVPNLSEMTPEERSTFVKNYREKKDLFNKASVSYVGAEKCSECHRSEYQSWQQTVHARVHATEAAKNAAPQKVFRFNTGTEKPGGYPTPGRAGVQCEMCHGPGERHLEKPERKGQEYIVNLAVECPSCVVEQICRLCHSPEDDPDFVFDEALKKVRHKPRHKTAYKSGKTTASWSKICSVEKP